MKKFILQVMKQPYRSGDNLRFKVFEVVNEVVAGATFHYKTVEHYEDLGFGEQNRVGSLVLSYLETKESEREVYYEISNDYEIGLLSRVANEIVCKNVSYQNQYQEFIGIVESSSDTTKL